MLPKPILKPITNIYPKPEENETKKPIAKYGRFLWLKEPHNPGPSLAGKPHCIVWNSILYGSWVLEGEEDGLEYGEAVHRAYEDWFLKANGSLYDEVLLEAPFALAPLTLRPDILYGKGGEYGIVEVKSYSVNRVDEALPQLALYVYGLRSLGFNVVQAFIALRDAVVEEPVEELYKAGEGWFRELRNAIRTPPGRPSRSCFRCPYALVCRVPKPSLF
jgi:CRISPR/Cas system-associated exonuclease Cas4 (RecB family)